MEWNRGHIQLSAASQAVSEARGRCKVREGLKLREHGDAPWPQESLQLSGGRLALSDLLRTLVALGCRNRLEQEWMPQLSPSEREFILRAPDFLPAQLGIEL